MLKNTAASEPKNFIEGVENIGDSHYQTLFVAVINLFFILLLVSCLSEATFSHDGLIFSTSMLAIFVPINIWFFLTAKKGEMQIEK